MATLSPTEDEIDDILYYSRTNCLSELKELLDSLSARSPLAMILTYAIDTLSGNSALHMSAANGHIGEPTLSTAHAMSPTSNSNQDRDTKTPQNPLNISSPTHPPSQPNKTSPAQRPYTTPHSTATSTP